ncbi:hypothetical protein JR316_0012397 [Psilocybe cubensis]|uniref:F-box domain-containing protein n=2 Tax=Psilocybe cubensis TaxID=181762 RepID=A0A8H7XRE8_PSICU|nr:hypothetical protein JR316_0012397 [Psilocybe cubensis]KAH9475286.1 hypothetical protein JR316_0012397 [Psilocybe cubensis]
MAENNFVGEQALAQLFYSMLELGIRSRRTRVSIVQNMRLPPELIIAILSHVDDRSALLKIRLVSKVCNVIVSPRAFHTLTVYRTTASLEGYQNIGLELECMELREHVEEIILVQDPLGHIDRSNDKDQTLAEWTPDIPVKGWEYLCLAMVPYFRNVNSLRVILSSEVSDDWYAIEGANFDPGELDEIENPRTRIHLQDRTMQLLGGIHDENYKKVPEKMVVGQLQTLEITNLAAYPCDAFAMAGMKNLLGGITRLKFRFLSNVAAGDFIYYHPFVFFWERKDLPIIMNTSQNLTSLELSTNVLRICDWNLFETLPKLEHISLTNFVFQYTARGLTRNCLESYILRHHKTLCRLELLGCCIDLTRTTSPQPCWADVFTRLETRLPKLQSFQFHPLPMISARTSDIVDYEGYACGHDDRQGYKRRFRIGLHAPNDILPRDGVELVDKDAYQHVKEVLDKRSPVAIA